MRLWESNFTLHLYDVAQALHANQLMQTLLNCLFIFSCTWLGKKCNVTRDFEMRATDMGICYTFNGDIDNVKDVDETASALSLILNVEQYEHMRGPQNDAGMKVQVNLLSPMDHNSNKHSFTIYNFSFFSVSHILSATEIVVYMYI